MLFVCVVCVLGFVVCVVDCLVVVGYVSFDCLGVVVV